MNIIKKIKNTLYPITSQYISHSTLVEGIIKNSEDLFRCRLVDNSDFIDNIIARTFHEKPRVLEKSRFWIPALRKMIDNSSTSIDYDICIAVIPKRYNDILKDIYSYKCDICVNQIIDLSEDLAEIKNKFHKKKRQISNTIISKSKFTYRISNDIKDFNLFYYQMFLPLIIKRHCDLSTIEPYEETKSYFKNGFLILVTYEDNIVSGALCTIKEKTIIFRRSGVLNGDEKYIKAGAQNALYLFLILYAKELGLKYLDTMKSLSILNDGVYNTKREWGAAVYSDAESESWVYIFIPKHTSKIVKFFEINPFIVHTNNGLSGLIGFNGELYMTDEVKSELNKKYYAPGINNIILLTTTSENAIVHSFLGP